MSIWDKNVPVEESSYYWKGEPKVFSNNQSNVSNAVVDLFCGAGGASHGFQMAGFNVVLGIDIHKPSMETFLYNHSNAAGILGDIRKVDSELLKKVLKKPAIKVLLAGVPCQGFSLNNRKRNGEDPRNYLFCEFIRIIKILKPDFVLLENVSGMKSMKQGEIVQEIESQIIKTGIETKKNYKVESRLLNAADYGVPQRRNRLIFIGWADNYNFRWPEITYSETQYRTVYDAIGDLPSLSAGETKELYEKDAHSEYQKIMRNSSNVLLNHSAPKHPQSTINKIASTKPGNPMYPKYKQRIRLAWDELSPTQVAGGIRPQFQFGHPGDNRGLTVRERARLQGFPDYFQFFGGVVQGRVQTGNAVPPLLAKAIAEQIMEQIK